MQPALGRGAGVPEAKRVSPLMFLRALVAKELQIEQDAVTDEQIAAANTSMNRLRWMLKETMGAVDEEERRRRVLSERPATKLRRHSLLHRMRARPVATRSSE